MSPDDAKLGRTAPIPPPAAFAFEGAIRHPDLWLWDSWIAGSGDAVDLYCLALSRRTQDGRPIAPGDRNDFAFHVRRFRTADRAGAWSDAGCVIAPSAAADGAFARNIWSGSALDLLDGRRLHAFTGVREAGSGRSFLQTLFLAPAASATDTPAPSPEALLCPERDYEQIRAAGYYLSRREHLGVDAGEEDGPILAWRDPFLFHAPAGTIELAWSAKTGPRTPAIGRAALREQDGKWMLAALHAPTPLPDAALMTQAEVPKIYHDPARGVFHLLLSASDRVREAQPDAEVSKQLRLYSGASAQGPWRPWSARDSALPGLDHVFGASVLEADFDAGVLSLVGPISERAKAAEQLTIGPIHHVPLYEPRALRRPA